MSESLVFKVDNKSVIAMLERLDTAFSPAGMALFLGEKIGPYLQKRAKDRFASEGDDVSGKWAPLMPATIVIRQEAGYGAGPINHRTGALEDWVTGGLYRANETTTGASLTYPNSKPTGELKKKVLTAQQGKANPRTVARPVLGVNQADMTFIITEMTYQALAAMKA